MSRTTGLIQQPTTADLASKTVPFHTNGAVELVDLVLVETKAPAVGGAAVEAVGGCTLSLTEPAAIEFL